MLIFLFKFLKGFVKGLKKKNNQEGNNTFFG